MKFHAYKSESIFELMADCQVVLTVPSDEKELRISAKIPKGAVLKLREVIILEIDNSSVRAELERLEQNVLPIKGDQ